MRRQVCTKLTGTLNIKRVPDGLLVTGDTYPHRWDFRKRGFIWDKKFRGWLRENQYLAPDNRFTAKDAKFLRHLEQVMWRGALAYARHRWMDHWRTVQPEIFDELMELFPPPPVPKVPPALKNRGVKRRILETPPELEPCEHPEIQFCVTTYPTGSYAKAQFFKAQTEDEFVPLYQSALALVRAQVGKGGGVCVYVRPRQPCPGGLSWIDVVTAGEVQVWIRKVKTAQDVYAKCIQWYTHEYNLRMNLRGVADEIEFFAKEWMKPERPDLGRSLDDIL